MPARCDNRSILHHCALKRRAGFSGLPVIVLRAKCPDRCRRQHPDEKNGDVLRGLKDPIRDKPYAGCGSFRAVKSGPANES
jgi:hypothetical protein